MSETSSNSQVSNSSTTPVETNENQIMDQISGVASGMANQLYNWAQGVYAQTSQITNEAVGNFFQTSQRMMGLSNNMIDQYNSLFAPENAQLVADANSYASPSRMAADMGMAGATAAQAGKASEDNSVMQLQQYGIDPSSGRYASLLNADNVQNAANIAGAENAQRVADTQMGQTLRAEAVQTGAQLPSSIANVENTGIQANTGAANAELANANTGANLMALPNSYLQTAMGLKMPFNAQHSSSMGSGQSQGNKGNPSGGNQGNNAGNSLGNGGGGSQGGYNGMANNPGPAMVSGAPGGSLSGPRVNPQQSGADPFTNYGDPWSNEQMTNPGPSPLADQSQTFGGAGGGYTGWDPSANPAPQDWTDPTGGWNTDQSVFGNPNTTTLGGFDPNAGGGGYNSMYQPGGIDPSTTDTSSWDYGSGYGGGDTTNGGYDTSGNNNSADTSSYDMGGGYGGGDTSGGDTSSMDSSSWGDPSGDNSFARGGSVPAMRKPPRYKMPNMMASGGQVPASASPSGGARVDDVRASGPGNSPMHLNANEFVIPRDVAMWKGQEFFQNLINDARKKNLMATAKPTVGVKPRSQI